ncbi:MAG TPA: electron transport complex subunit E [Clostridiales bacterium]|nr:electron transport complex subunit E [Clostridiales bacterium]
MAKQKKLSEEFTKGIIKENPVLRLVLGTCPTLALTTSVTTAIGMGISATLVLICSNIVISALRKVISPKIRIPAYIVIIASFVTIVQMAVKAYVPVLDEALGVFLPLIVVNCIILGRAEAFAGKNPVLASAVDGLGMGVGFTVALIFMATIRETIGAGSFLAGAESLLGAFGITGFNGFSWADKLATVGLEPMLIFILPAGGFFVFGILIALANKIAEGKGKKPAELHSCEHCSMRGNCPSFSQKEDESK